MTVMTITFGQDLCIDFDVEANPIADLWLQKMDQRHRWPLDDPRRFYGFDDAKTAKLKLENSLKSCIDTINRHQHIIERSWTGIDDQDFLNYLHNIFEKYHGLLDQQDTDWWNRAPEEAQKALANLNILVHRAEALSRGNLPRVVCTWFGMPKDTMLTEDLVIKHGRLAYEFGGVYLNYVEIGKTAEELSIDDDHYISDDAFQPFLHYSADFNIRFYDRMADIARIYRYYEKHRTFFQSRGIEEFDDYRLMPWRYKIAQMRWSGSREEIVDALRSRQHITDIYLA